LHELRKAPSNYFLFGPMTFDSIAYRNTRARADEEVRGTAGAFCT
jgi:hypothetical protein